MEMSTLVRAAFDCASSAAARNETLGPLEIDYLHIHYCVFAGAPLVSYAVLAAWLCLLFFFLGSTADGYFSPTLASISEKLYVPYDVAGVTFLAFGNGAPDVFSAIAAYSTGVGEAGINELLGGSMFVSTVVVGFVAIASTVDVQRWAFSRDVSALVASLLLLLVLASRQASDEPAHTTSDLTQLVFLVAYALYVSSVVLPACLSRVRRAHQQLDPSSKLAIDDSVATRGVLSAFWHALSPRGQQQPPRSPTSYAFVTKADSPRNGLELGSPRKTAPAFASDVVEDHFQDFTDESSLSSPLISDADREAEESVARDFSGHATFSHGARILESAYWRHLRWRWRLKRRIVQLNGGSESLLMKMLGVPNMVLVVMRDATVPLLDSESWSRSLAALSWITVPLLLLWTSGQAAATCGGPYDTPVWVLLIGFGVGMALVVSYTTHRSRPPTSLAYSTVFLLLAFIACVCWIYAVATELVALLVAVGTITNASTSLLGLTVLSWGNSVGDLITNVSVARSGFPEMAIAGCYGGPVFNILLGLGIPMAVAFLRDEEQRMGFDDHAWISMGFLFVSLVTSFWVFRRYDYTCPRWYGKVLLVYYAVYATVNVVVALRKHEDVNP